MPLRRLLEPSIRRLPFRICVSVLRGHFDSGVLARTGFHVLFSPRAFLLFRVLLPRIRSKALKGSLVLSRSLYKMAYKLPFAFPHCTKPERFPQEKNPARHRGRFFFVQPDTDCCFFVSRVRQIEARETRQTREEKLCSTVMLSGIFKRQNHQTLVNKG